MFFDRITHKFRRNILEYSGVQTNRECRTYRRRVVVTGIGLVSPIGCTVKSAWQNILNGYCGIKALQNPKYDSLPCKIAAQIDADEIKLHDHFSKTELRSIAPATSYALIAGSFQKPLRTPENKNKMNFVS